MANSFCASSGHCCQVTVPKIQATAREKEPTVLVKMIQRRGDQDLFSGTPGGSKILILGGIPHFRHFGELVFLSQRIEYYLVN
jgi:hypothetical protein